MKEKDTLAEVMKKEFSVRLGRRRNEMDLTQEKAAELCGVTLREYQTWEQGKSLPGLPNAARIRAAMGLSLDDLADEVTRAKETAMA